MLYIQRETESVQPFACVVLFEEFPKSLYTYFSISQIRYASLERLFDRLLDLRFLSVEFLNTFLITYRIFTDAETILKRLETFYEKRKRSLSLPTSNGDIRLCSTTLRTCSLKEKRFGRHLQGICITDQLRFISLIQRKYYKTLSSCRQHFFQYRRTVW